MAEPIELLPPAEATPDNPRWHEIRRGGITASEIAAVMGISPYESPFSLYWRKVNGWEFEGNEYTRAGQHLEASIADWWAAERDVALERAGLYANTERPWQLATPDRLVHDACPTCAIRPPESYGCSDCMNTGLGSPMWTLLECKWVAHSWDGWGEPGSADVPVHYRAQGLWQLDVMGVGEVHFAALGPGGFRAYRVERDETDLKLMREAGAEFYRRLLEQDPPPLDSHTATVGTLKRLHPLVEDGEVETTVELAEAYRKARAEKAAAEAKVDGYEAQIRALLGSQRKAVCKGKLVASRSVYERKPYSVGPGTVDKLNPGRADSYA